MSDDPPMHREPDGTLVAWTANQISDRQADLDARATQMASRPRMAFSDALLAALTEDQKSSLASVKTSDVWRFTARREPYPENNPLIFRVATKLGTTPKDWFDAVLGK